MAVDYATSLASPTIVAHVFQWQDMAYVTVSPMERLPSALLAPDIEQLFARWLDDTALHSSVDTIRAHVAFKQLRAFGWAVIPSALRKLSNGSGRIQCMELLHEVVEQDPVTPDSYGKTSKMAAAWLAWGHRNNFI